MPKTQSIRLVATFLIACLCSTSAFAMAKKRAAYLECAKSYSINGSNYVDFLRFAPKMDPAWAKMDPFFKDGIVPVLGGYSFKGHTSNGSSIDVSSESKLRCYPEIIVHKEGCGLFCMKITCGDYITKFLFVTYYDFETGTLQKGIEVRYPSSSASRSARDTSVFPYCAPKGNDGAHLDFVNQLWATALGM